MTRMESIKWLKEAKVLDLRNKKDRQAVEMAIRGLERWGKLWRWLATLDHSCDSEEVLNEVDHCMCVIEYGEE